MPQAKTYKDLKKRDDVDLGNMPGSDKITKKEKEVGFRTPVKFIEYAQDSLNEIRMNNAQRISAEANAAKELSELMGSRAHKCPKCKEGTIQATVYIKGDKPFVRFICTLRSRTVPGGGCNYEEILPFDKVKARFKK